MPRKTAGAGYPHISSTARQHDHRLCVVIERIAERAERGDEPWGTRHDMPLLPGEDIARATRMRFFGVKKCKRLEKRFGELMSVKCEYEEAKGGWLLWVQVWPRSLARAEITARVQRGERLHYNAYREN